MKIFKILLCISLLFTLSSCFITTSKDKAFYDDAFIKEEGDSYTYFIRNGNYDHFLFQDFSGTETIFRSEISQTIDIKLSFKIDKGLFKVVLIDPKGNIEILDQGEYQLNLEEGLYRIKIVGSHAFGKLEFESNGVSS